MLTWVYPELNRIATDEEIEAWRERRTIVAPDEPLLHLVPRWNGLPARWYSCFYCDFLVQLGSDFNGEKASGRWLEHQCPSFVAAAFERTGVQPVASLSNPWRAVELGLRAIYA